jgi:3-deoxy-7-phosphoheptulonate synthase
MASYTVQHTLPSYEEISERFPISEKLKEKVKQDRVEIEDILSGKDSRKFIIVGPCSSWPSESVIEYAKKLAPLAEKTKDVLKIIMRTYIQKPRTVAGWMGPLVQPDPFSEPHIPNGIFYCREMMIQVLEMGLPIADEILFPRCQSYFRELLSWAAIGARSSENQEHRVLASLLEFPIGVKNPTSGDISTGINSVLAAQSPNYLAVSANQLKTTGNPYAHLVLRGGGKANNVSSKDLEFATQLLQEKNIKNPSIVVDLSHDNCCDEHGKKQYKKQIDVLWSTLNTMMNDSIITSSVKGWMAESFLQEGNQKLIKKSIIPGKSVTDECLGWEDTEKLLLKLSDILRKEMKHE